MKTTLLAFALAILPAPAAILTADLVGIPHGYSLYEVQDKGRELLRFRHSGSFSIDSDTGLGLLRVSLEITGGLSAGLYGGLGAVHTGQADLSMTPADVAMLWAGLLALPDQPYYWGGNPWTEIPVHVENLILGGICIGCGSMPMGAFYMTQNTPAFNFWTDRATLFGDQVLALDMVFRADRLTHSPEPTGLALIALGLIGLYIARGARQ